MTISDPLERQPQGWALVWPATAALAVASIARVGAAAVRGAWLHEFTWSPTDLPWMTLVGNAIIFSGVALVLWILTRRMARTTAFAVAMAVIGFLLMLSIMLLITEIWQYASLLLSAGVAWRIRIATGRRPDVMQRLARRIAVVALPLALLLAARSAWTGAREPSESTAAADAPSVLVIILDTVRASSMSLYGYSQRTTPVLDALAGEAVVFDRAVATAPWTLPSHCSLFTGLDAQRTSCRWTTPLDSRATTLAEVLKGRGYRTGGFVANHFYTTRETGLSRGFDRWMDFQRTWKEVFCSTVLVQTGIVRSALWGATPRERLSGILRFKLRGDPKPEHDRKDAATVNREFLAWLDEAPARPYFAVLNYFDAHDPYVAPPPFDTAFAPGTHGRGTYDGGVAYMDQQIGALLDVLRQRRQLDHTVVVIASDHGELFGEHALYGHGNSLYWPLLHVPLLIRYPGRVPAARRIASTVSLRDVAATVLDLLGAPDLRIGGASLAGTWRDTSAAPASAALSFVEKGKNWWGTEPARTDSLSSITVGAWQLIASHRGHEELFDLTEDPLGLADRTATDSAGIRSSALRDALRRAAALPVIATPSLPR